MEELVSVTLPEEEFYSRKKRIELLYSVLSYTALFIVLLFFDEKIINILKPLNISINTYGIISSYWYMVGIIFFFINIYNSRRRIQAGLRKGIFAKMSPEKWQNSYNMHFVSWMASFENGIIVIITGGINYFLYRAFTGNLSGGFVNIFLSVIVMNSFIILCESYMNMSPYKRLADVNIAIISVAIITVIALLYYIIVNRTMNVSNIYESLVPAIKGYLNNKKYDSGILLIVIQIFGIRLLSKKIYMAVSDLHFSILARKARYSRGREYR